MTKYIRLSSVSKYSELTQNRAGRCRTLILVRSHAVSDIDWPFLALYEIPSNIVVDQFFERGKNTEQLTRIKLNRGSIQLILVNCSVNVIIGKVCK